MVKTPKKYLPLVVSIVLNTNHRDDTLACFSALLQNSYSNQGLILLDNASTDGTIEAVRSCCPQAQIIELVDNLGYAGNNNVGISAAMNQGADWVLVLNEDVWLDPECIEQLVVAGESDPAVGIVGPMVYHADEPAVIQSAGGMLDRHLRDWHLGQDQPDEGQFSAPHPVDWISGCGIMVRRAVIEQVGMIDPRFFYYLEELEWCLRAKRAGWKIVHVPQAKLWHKGVQRNYQPKPSVTYYSTRNRLLLLRKHHASLAAWVVNGTQTARTLVSWSVKPKWRSKRAHRDAMLRGIVDFTRSRWGRMT